MFESSLVPELRQGDILKDIPIVSAVDLNRYNEIGAVSWAVAAKPERGACMVLSHSCEIDLRNKVKVTSLILAPIRDCRVVSRDKLDLLKNSNDLKDGATHTFLKYFYLERHPGIPIDGESVVDFSKLFSLRKNAVESLSKTKVAQLTTDAVTQMARKLAAYFYRT